MKCSEAESGYLKKEGHVRYKLSAVGVGHGHRGGGGLKEKVRTRRFKGYGLRPELQVSDAGQSLVIRRRM